MQDLPQVHWHEGLFLKPHHLQTMQRHLLERFASERRLVWPYPYGVVDAQVSTDALENFRVQFDRLRAVMPSGLEVRVPEMADLPSLDIKNAFTSSSGSLTVCLGVSLWSSERGNSIDLESRDDLRTRKLYRVEEIERPDENTGENAQPVLVRRVNARLLLEDDDRTDLEVLPLLRIGRATGEAGSMPKQDTEYVPPSLVLSGSPTLYKLLRDLTSQVGANRTKLQKILRSGYTIESLKGVQVRRMMKLKTLNRFTARLEQLVEIPMVTPLTVYLELRDLLAELEALEPEREPAEIADYDHDNLMLVFDVLSRSIRDLLPELEDKPYRALGFEREDRYLVAQLSADDLEKPNEYFLQVRDGGDPTAVADLITDKKVFKVMPRSQALKPIPGIPLEEERNPPVELPNPPGTQYFRLLRARNRPVWKKIHEEGCVAVFWKGLETSPLQISLCMTFSGSGS